MDALGNIFSSSLAAYFVYYVDQVTAANSGFELSLAVFFGSLLLYWVRTVNMFEVQGKEINIILMTPALTGISPLGNRYNHSIILG